jgi:hemerythrin-like domain-containing protein
MKPTEQLKEEHKSIELMLRILEKVCEKLESGEKINPEHLEKILEFIKVFVDKCHHAKEEAQLFPAMEEAGIPKHGGPIGVMLLEHDTGRDYVKGISEALEKYKEGDLKAASYIIENAKNYIALLKQHIVKEDNILYPMAEVCLSEKKQGELLERFEIIEQEKIGAGKHEEFHKLLHYLREVYL